MIDYSECTKEELIELAEHYASLVIAHDRCLYRVVEPTEEEIYHLLKGDCLNVKYIESENE